MKKDDVHRTMRRVTDRLAKRDIPYAVLGGMAHRAAWLLARHDRCGPSDDEARVSNKIHQRLVGRGFVPAYPGARKRLRDTTDRASMSISSQPASIRAMASRRPFGFRIPPMSVNRDGYQRAVICRRLIELQDRDRMTVDYRHFEISPTCRLSSAKLQLPRHLPNKSIRLFAMNTIASGSSPRNDDPEYD